MLTLAETTTNLDFAKWIPVLPAAALAINGLLGCFRASLLRKATAVVTIAATAAAFVLSCVVLAAMGDPAEFHGATVKLFDWINIAGFSANFSFFIDPLTVVMLIVVTGVGTLIAIYAAGYMAGDPGYFRFFSYIALFIFTMTCLVMADNLLLLYLGWEGVGLSSYLLIGFYYRKPSAAAAAKKAFIVNRVGDFGFALGVMGIFLAFGTIEYSGILPAAAAQVAGVEPTDLAAPAFAAFVNVRAASEGLILAIPFLLMLGAFGKSAQLPLHVWLPDAMEGPTPVSALIHAATMVTAGVYMIARLLPIFELSPYALPTVAVIGAITALFAASIALCQYDIKRIWAYSTISQLGYMFLGVGMLTTFGAVFHLFTHAFFKALLFLTAGSVMHALAGQLDLRKMSGLMRPMPITGILMLVGCLALAGFPFTAGFFSKDTIIAEPFIRGGALGQTLGVIAIVTALLTAFYTFRLWFRVFLGETEYEMGREHHGYEVDHPLDDHAGPHEVSWLMNGPLVVLALGALVLGIWLGGKDGWMYDMVQHSTAAVGEAGHGEAETAAAAGPGDAALAEQAHPGHDAAHTIHLWVSIISGGGAVGMILLAGYFHWLRRSLAGEIARRLEPVLTVLYHKYYVDELYHAFIVLPLRLLAWISYLIDKWIIDGVFIDRLAVFAPRLAGHVQRPFQSGQLQGYAIMMGAGLALVLAAVWWLAQ